MKRVGQKESASRYSMLIDLDRCNGCGSCMVACAVENNIPPAPASADDRKGMNWMRVYRVATEEKTAFVPIMCQQCEHDTPCVSVCPQNAVELDTATGIVGQIPQRCLGCRYCVAACPYHARIFNWWDPKWPAGMDAMLNPAVSPRMRGTVEKCNMCHGRWHEARLKSTEKTEYTPACVEACPSQAIRFGDLNDANSELAKEVAAGRAFRMLESLNTGTKVYYKTQSAAVRKAVAGEVKS